MSQLCSGPYALSWGILRSPGGHYLDITVRSHRGSPTLDPASQWPQWGNSISWSLPAPQPFEGLEYCIVIYQST